MSTLHSLTHPKYTSPHSHSPIKNVDQWKVHQFQAFQFDYFILIWVFILFIFILSPEFLWGGSLHYTYWHLVSHQKFTYHHCIGFLQMCKPRKKAKALELRITLWHVTYMWLFHLLVCWIIFFLIQEVFWKDNLRNKNYQLKV